LVDQQQPRRIGLEGRRRLRGVLLVHKPRRRSREGAELSDLARIEILGGESVERAVGSLDQDERVENPNQAPIDEIEQRGNKLPVDLLTPELDQPPIGGACLFGHVHSTYPPIASSVSSIASPASRPLTGRRRPSCHISSRNG